MSARGWVVAALAMAGWVLAMGWPGQAQAQSQPQSQASDAWQFKGMVYVYLPDIGGTTRFPADGGGTEITVPSDAILDSMSFAFMGTLEARKGRWGVFTDIIYLDVDGNSTGRRDFQVGQQQIPAGVAGDFDLAITATSWTLAGEYAAVDTPTSELNVLAGTRFLDLQQELGYELSADVGALVGPGRSGQVETSASYWDAVVGIKGRAVFGSDGQWSLPYYADVGTGESELTWQVFGGVGYRFASWGSVIGGWRHIAYDFKSGSAVQSLDLDGPMVGMTFNW